MIMNSKRNLHLIMILCALLVFIGTWAFIGWQPPLKHVAYVFAGNDADRHAFISSPDALQKETVAGMGVALAAAASPLDVELRTGFKPGDDLITLNSQAKLSAPAWQVDKVVYLTFDDGPSIHTEHVLDILQEENVKGTFFVLGQQVERNPKLAERIIKEGHALGNHSYNHNYSEMYRDFSNFWRQIKQTGEAIRKITGYEPVLVRAPGGTFLNFDKQYFDLMNQAGYFVYDWHVDSGDSKRRGISAKEISRNVKEGALLPSTIVLMHDGVGHGETVRALPEIIRHYKAKGYSFAVLSPGVKPVQFKVATKMRWSRTPISPAWISTNVKPIQVVNSEEPQLQQRSATQPYKSTERISEAQQQQQSQKLTELAKPNLSLSLSTDQGEIEFAPDQFMSDQDRIYVPLRVLMERLNGTVVWNSEVGYIDVERHNVTIGIDARAGELKISKSPDKNGEVKSQSLDIVTQQSATWGPLRQILDALGIKLISYELFSISSTLASKRGAIYMRRYDDDKATS